MKLKIAVVSAVNNEKVLNENLLQSALLRSPDTSFFKIENALNAGQAYNQGIQLASGVDADLIIFAHQDVYLPEDWHKNFIMACEHLNNNNIKWGVLGLFGRKSNGQRVGRVWDSGLDKELDNRVTNPEQVETLDELLLVLNNKHDLRFDENLPGFHLYGADICTQATTSKLSLIHI